MKKLLLFAVSFIVAAQCAYAASKQSGTFTCTSGLSLPLTSFYLEIQAPGDRGMATTSFVTITTDVTQFQSLFADVISGRLDDTCEVQVSDKKTGSSPALKFLDVDALLVSVTGDKESQYVTATFNFGRIEDLATSSTTSTKGPATLTPDQRNKALTQFLARAPKPSAN